MGEDGDGGGGEGAADREDEGVEGGGGDGLVLGALLCLGEVELMEERERGGRGRGAIGGGEGGGQVGGGDGGRLVKGDRVSTRKRRSRHHRHVVLRHRPTKRPWPSHLQVRPKAGSGGEGLELDLSVWDGLEVRSEQLLPNLVARDPKAGTRSADVVVARDIGGGAVGAVVVGARAQGADVEAGRDFLGGEAEGGGEGDDRHPPTSEGRGVVEDGGARRLGEGGEELFASLDEGLLTSVALRGGGGGALVLVRVVNRRFAEVREGFVEKCVRRLGHCCPRVWRDLRMGEETHPPQASRKRDELGVRVETARGGA